MNDVEGWVTGQLSIGRKGMMVMMKVAAVSRLNKDGAKPGKEAHLSSVCVIHPIWIVKSKSVTDSSEPILLANYSQVCVGR